MTGVLRHAEPSSLSIIWFIGRFRAGVHLETNSPQDCRSLLIVPYDASPTTH